MTLADAVEAQFAMTAAYDAYLEAVAQRDAAIMQARNSGEPANAIAGALNLSRQQVHKIIEKQTAASKFLDGGAPYAALLPEDRDFVDWASGERG